MTLRNLRDDVMRCLAPVLEELGWEEEPPIEEPPKKEFGDFSTSVALKMARRLKRDPGPIAAEIASRIKPVGLVARVEATPTGYVNFFTDIEKLAAATLAEVERLGRRYGSVDLGKGKRVLVEHTSVNPNKALHVGHARNVALGTALANLLSFTGYDVEVANYVDDSGAQMAEVVAGMLYLGYGEEAPLGMKYDHYVGDVVYVGVSRRAEEDPDVEKLRRDVAKKIEEGGNPVAEFARAVADRVLREQLKTCWELGARYDLLVWETDIVRSGLWEKAFELLRKLPIVEFVTEGEHEGCWVVRLTKTRKYAKETDKVLVRSDGTTTYVAKDIAFAMWKLGLVEHGIPFGDYVIQPDGTVVRSTGSGEERRSGGAWLSVNVIDVRQSRLQDTIKIVLSALFGPDVGARYVHYAYEVVTLSADTVKELFGEEVGKKLIHMSGRRGIYVNVDTVLDELSKRAAEECVKRNPDAPKEWVDATARKIAVAALKYPLLAQDVNKVVVFDLASALRVTEESGPYIQYAYARACRVIEKAGVKPKVPDKVELATEEDEALVRAIARFPLVVEDAARSMSPPAVAKYAYELARTFNTFYEKCPVIGAEGTVRDTRLALTEAFRRTLEVCCDILAMPLPQRI